MRSQVRFLLAPPVFGQVLLGLDEHSGGTLTTDVCAPYGLDLRKPATLYLIEQPELRAAKIGIAESTSDRIDVHIRHGWRVIKVWQFKTGELAGRAENAVLEYFRDELKLPPFLRPADMPQGGFTETVSALTISIDEIERVISNSSKSGLKVES